MLRKLQGAIEFGNAPIAEREELAGDVTEIMDAAFEVMKKLPTNSPKSGRLNTKVGESLGGVVTPENTSPLIILLNSGGSGRNRTGVDGFAIRCITTLPPSQGATSRDECWRGSPPRPRIIHTRQ